MKLLNIQEIPTSRFGGKSRFVHNRVLKVIEILNQKENRDKAIMLNVSDFPERSPKAKPESVPSSIRSVVVRIKTMEGCGNLRITSRGPDCYLWLER